MHLYKLVMPKDEAYDIVNDLGKIDCCHFLDMNKNKQAYTLTYTDQIKRCEEVERKIAFIEQECERMKLKLWEPHNIEMF